MGRNGWEDLLERGEKKGSKKRNQTPKHEGKWKNGKMEKKKRKWENGWLRMRKQKQRSREK